MVSPKFGTYCRNDCLTLQVPCVCMHILFNWLLEDLAISHRLLLPLPLKGVIQLPSIVYFAYIGYLYITGRIKEILITKGGENVAPVPIEENMMDQMKLLSYCMVIGDNQKYLTMFVTLRCEVGGCGL